MDNTKGTIETFGKYVVPNYTRNAIVIVRGKGSRVWDADGNCYLDLFPGWGVCGLGHCHPAVTKAVQKQAAVLQHMPNNFYHPWQGELARLISENSFGGKTFFCNSGAEAVEAAIKLARLHSPEGKHGFVTMENSFHGRTFAAITATGQEKYHKGFAPLVSGFKYAQFNDLRSVEALVDDSTCAIMTEVIQGEGGINVAGQDFVSGLRQLCDDRRMLLIIDEVQTGMGRTGEYFGYKHYSVQPDIMTLAKALGGGVAVGACVASADVAGSMKPGTHASTFGGNPVACAAAIAVFEVIEAEGLLRHTIELGSYLREELQKIQADDERIVEIRGKGLMVGVELSIAGSELVTECMRRGLLINCTHDTVIRFLPAMNVTRDELDEGLSIFRDVLDSLSKEG
jgi:acetylornithine/N-succinyldiaminopimelate aminotransferase